MATEDAIVIKVSDISDYRTFMAVFELLKTPDEINKLFEHVPNRGVLNVSNESLLIKILMTVRADLIQKHTVTTESNMIRNLIDSTKFDIDTKKLYFDLLVKSGIQLSDVKITDVAQFLRWIPVATSISKEDKISLCDYCFEKGYLAGINDGLNNTMSDGSYTYLDVTKFLEAGADPTVIHSSSYHSGISAMDYAFKYHVRAAKEIKLFAKYGYDVTSRLSFLGKETLRKMGFQTGDGRIRRMINGVLFSLAEDTKTATAIELKMESDVPVTTELSVVATNDGHYLLIDSVLKTVFGEPIPVTAFA